MAQTLHLHQPKQLLTLPQLVVTFDETLKLEQQEVPASADEVSKEIEQHFKLAYGYSIGLDFVFDIFLYFLSLHCVHQQPI